MTLSLIVALTDAGVIGRGGALPWHLGADLQRFKQLTMGHAILMGRKTWDSIGRPLPGRRSIVISRNPDFALPGIPDTIVVRSLADALRAAAVGGDDEVFVIGGADIFRLALPHADRLYLTRVEADVPGDVYFPEYNRSAWRLVERNRFAADAKNDYPYAFEVYDRHQEPTMADEAYAELLELSDQLLSSIAAGDWETYQSLCDPSLSCFEPEARGHLVEGLEFHQFYFQGGPSTSPRNNTICSPHVRLMGDVAVISYIRLVQKCDDAGNFTTAQVEETRVWQRQEGGWQHVHFHRSLPG